MNPIKVGIIGAGGRIGNELLNLIQTGSNFEATLGVGRHSKGFKDNVADFNVINSVNLDVLIDFSSPEFLEKTLEFSMQNKIPLVSGTTGISPTLQSKLEHSSKHIPLLWAPNMSLGVAVLKKALSNFKPLKHFDFQVEEWHHNRKKDSPSGTAVMLKNELDSIINKETPPTMVMRAGGIYGVHKIYAVSDEELISFEHTALNRTVFARGSLVAAEWLIKQRPGYYSINDVIS